MASRKSSGQLFPSEVFVSHSHADHAFTLKISADLARHGVPVWFSERNIRGAQQWLDEIGAALDRCDWMVVILTPEAVKSHWVGQEVRFALGDKRYRDRVIPVELRRCEAKKLAWPLVNMQIISGRPYAEALRQLLAIWGIGYRDQ